MLIFFVELRKPVIFALSRYTKQLKRHKEIYLYKKKTQNKWLFKTAQQTKVLNNSKRDKRRKGPEAGEAGRAVPAEKTTQIHNKGLSTLGPQPQHSTLFFWPGKFKKKGKKRFKGTFLSKHDKDYIQSW